MTIYIIFGVLLCVVGFVTLCAPVFFGIQTGRPKTAIGGVLLGLSIFGAAVLVIHAGVNLEVR